MEKRTWGPTGCVRYGAGVKQGSKKSHLRCWGDSGGSGQDRRPGLQTEYWTRSCYKVYLHDTYHTGRGSVVLTSGSVQGMLRALRVRIFGPTAETTFSSFTEGHTILWRRLSTVQLTYKNYVTERLSGKWVIHVRIRAPITHLFPIVFILNNFTWWKFVNLEIRYTRLFFPLTPHGAYLYECLSFKLPVTEMLQMM
jgi:hypothetical protein